MGWGSRALKAVGVLTALISLALGIQQIVTRVGGAWHENREAATLRELARQQAARGEFGQAWSSLDRAAALGSAEAAEAARVDVAFAWLEDARPGPGRPFNVITETVTPALDRALLSAKGERRADIVAHLGWATFLRLRDGVTGDPAARYEEALALDPGNPYANAMLGHWLMWRGGSVAAARERFETALARGGASRAFVRRFQLASLVNRGADAEAELLRVASAMREHGEALDPRTADSLYALYTRRYGPTRATTRVEDGAIAPASALAVYEWVLQTPGATTRPAALTAVIRSALQEAAGDPRAALTTLRELRERERLTSPLREHVDRAVTRLSAAR